MGYTFLLTVIHVGIIRHYRLRVTPVGGGISGGTFIIDGSTTSIVLNVLSCCTSYTYSLSAYTIAYGPPTSNSQFQTSPDLSSEFKNYSEMTLNNMCIFLAPIDVTTSVVSSTEITVSWVTPQSITDQGVTQYQVAVTSLCSAQGVLPTQLFTITTLEEPSLNISGLGK